MTFGQPTLKHLTLHGIVSDLATSQIAGDTPGAAGTITTLVKWTIPSGVIVKMGPTVPRPRAVMTLV